MSDSRQSSNDLLAALPKKEFLRLFPHLKKVSLEYGDTLCQSGEAIRHVYFVETGVVSLLATVEDSATLEISLVGNEGMVGLPVFLGVATANNFATVQGQGTALRMTSADFRSAIKLGGRMPDLLKRFTYSLMSQIAQCAVCNRFHPIEKRLARWLLMTNDRIDAPEFQITQDLLASMLGVRREAVSKAAVLLQQQGHIRYSRGRVAISNRAELETLACSCLSDPPGTSTNLSKLVSSIRLSNARGSS